jgi:hypothetical protein
MAIKLIPYSRFSDGPQEAGDSTRRQDDLAEQAAREEGVEVDWTLSLKDKGISAFRGRNWKKGNLGKFIDLVDAGIVPPGSILCIERVNRLSRMPWMAQVEQWKQILSRGIIIRTCVPPARYTKDNMDDLAVGCPVVIFMMLGHQESKQKSEWSFEAFDARKAEVRKEGIPHGLRCPDWVERIQVPHPKDPQRKITTGYRLRPERAALLAWMHERAQAGWGSHRIRNHLVSRKVPPWGWKGKWSAVRITNLLTSRQAFGEYQPTRLDGEGQRVPDGPPLSGHYPAVITEECWRQTQAARKKRQGKGGYAGESLANLFTHLVFDAACEEALHHFTIRKWRYLTIEGVPWTFPYRDFERAILTALAQLRASDVDGRHQADALTLRVETLQAERSALGIDLDDLDRQLREVPPQKRSKRIVARMCELEEEIVLKDEELREAKVAATTSTRVEALVDLRNSLNALDEAAEKGDPREMQALRLRVKGRIPFLVESIWVRVQVLTKRARYVHVRIYLHGGEERYLFLTCGHPQVAPLFLEEADFRGGEERGYCADSRRSKFQTNAVAL